MKKIITFLLILVSFIISICTISNTFDGDYGWHLRFGRDAFENNFQYLDSYTWPNYGQPWVNHEWGGDIIFWFLYSHFGHFAIVLLTAVSLTTSIIIVQKTFNKEINISFGLSATLSIMALQFIMAPRLAMIGPLFFSILVWTLEKIPQRKTYYLWPILIWLWSTIHGSWILAFITINIYIVGQIGQTILKKHWPKYMSKEIAWNLKTYINIILFEFISIGVILINPYGYRIITEVISYFTENFYKEYIIEWLPSYTYPIFIWPLILATTMLVFMVHGYLKKKVTLAQFLLFTALFYTTLRHKRNNLYMVVACAPVLTFILDKVTKELPKLKKILIYTLFPITILLIYNFTKHTNITNNVWENEKLLTRPPMIYPYDCANFLRQKTDNEKIKIFNEFWWGGYLNWALPNALVYFDGRGTATWHYNDSQTMLQKYGEIKFGKDGLKELNNYPINYILLEKNPFKYRKANQINRFLVGDQKIKTMIADSKTPLIEELNASPIWETIYDDDICQIWQKK